TRKLPTPGGRLSCTRENDPVRDSSGKQHTNKCLMCGSGHCHSSHFPFSAKGPGAGEKQRGVEEEKQV
uniref:Kazal-like domain-containing protein n=1 Tax=Strix occidentalis caurina TaxID=311401 RepID=A0A8D0FXQ2_STROC